MNHVADQSRAVTFRTGRDLYAVDVQSVERVVRYVPPRAVPRLPAWIEGIVEIDGRVIPVVDLRRRLGIDATPAGPQTRMLLLVVEEQWCGVIVDQVLDVRRYAPSDLSEPPPLVRGLAGEFVRGTLRSGDTLVLLLDTAHLFSAGERLALESTRELERAHA
jgi:purine-binding chemotaxis protein CheW